MKVFPIEMFNCNVYVYNVREFSLFNERCEERISITDCGRTSGNHVWINTGLDDLQETCTHEAVHVVDWILEEHLRCVFNSLDGSTELRAYMVEYIGGKIYKAVKEMA